VRIVRPFFVYVSIIAAIVSLYPSQMVLAQETMTITEEPGMAAAGPGSTAGDCGCRSVQRPPWHGSVRSQPCGPACAPACGPARSPCHSGSNVKPSCFPRLHTWCRDGYMPSPVPPTLPRCHQCGAVVEGGF